MSGIRDLEPKLVWEIFDDITRVPRPSKREEKIERKCKTDAAEREQRVLAHFAEPRGGKALDRGVNAKCKMQNAM